MAIGDRECVVCTELKGVDAFPNTPLTADCHHAQDACLECVSRSIHTHVEAESWTGVPCPECNGTLSYEAIHRYSDARICQRYDEMCLRRTMQEDNEFVWVLALATGPVHGVFADPECPSSVPQVAAVDRSTMVGTNSPL